MTAATTSSPSLMELRRAWAAVQSGAFAEQPGPSRTGPPTGSGGGWRLAPGEWVVPVVKCPGTIGATTVAVALATAAGDARVLECSSFTGSGLSAASTAELGADSAGWIGGTRGPVRLQRCSEVVCSVAEVPAPTAADRALLTVVDVGWDVGSVMSSPGWLRAQLIEADTVVVVTVATSPGLRHLETLAAMLSGDRLVVAVIGPPPRKWPAGARRALGGVGRDLFSRSRLVAVARDRRLAVAGLTGDSLPTAVLAAASHLLTIINERTPR